MIWCSIKQLLRNFAELYWKNKVQNCKFKKYFVNCVTYSCLFK